MGRSIGYQHHHLGCILPPIDTVESGRHPSRDGFRSVSASGSVERAEERLYGWNGRGEGEDLGDIGVVLRRVISIGDDLEGVEEEGN
jgi:hypothetical protein